MRNPKESQLTLPQRARRTLNRVRFASGIRVGGIELSPRLSGGQRAQLGFWVRRLPASFQKQLPPLKLAAAEQLRLVGTCLFINENWVAGSPQSQADTHAASYIPERYVVLGKDLFSRRVELGRIFYHELCHFLWLRLGNPKRLRFAALLQWEFQKKIPGELGHSSQRRKEKLWAGRTAASRALFHTRQWREYVCESFCDTGSFVLLDRQRRANHSEYTLARTARQRRIRLWSEMVHSSASPQTGKNPADKTIAN